MVLKDLFTGNNQDTPTIWNIIDVIAAILLIAFCFAKKQNKNRALLNKQTSMDWIHHSIVRVSDSTIVSNGALMSEHARYRVYLENGTSKNMQSIDCQVIKRTERPPKIVQSEAQQTDNRVVASGPSTESEEAHQIIEMLNDNGISCFYHFTSKRNLASIEEHGGLYSWKEMEKRGINAPFIGGSGDDGLSHRLDEKAGLSDYVRLSFCKKHPMAYRHEQNGEPLVLLLIDIGVAVLRDTQFSSMNATDSKCKVARGLDGLKLLDFNAVRRTYVSRDDPDFKSHQAEILVKNHIPFKCIKYCKPV
ncbi:MAG: DUF4433 domain-containing protein [Bacteroidales bacterium]|nr:DUF4433 domain-containing protein [Bacteroidales bacterium]